MKVPLAALSASLLLLVSTPVTVAFKASDFKTCSQSGFCRRGRALAARAKENVDTWRSPYSVDPQSISLASGKASLTAAVKSTLYPDVKFGLEVRLHEDGVVRVRMDEVGGLKKRYDEAAKWALAVEPSISAHSQWKVGASSARAMIGGPKMGHEVVVEFKPLRVVLNKNGREQVVVNGRGLLHMEHYRNKAVEEPKVEPPEGGETQEVLKINPNAWFEGDSEDAYWEETFGSWTDSKPKGKLGHYYRLAPFQTVVIRSRIFVP